MVLLTDNGINSVGLKSKRAHAWKPVDIVAIGSSVVVTTEMLDQFPDGDDKNEGIVTTHPHNRVIIKTLGFDDIVHNSGAKVYGRITESGGVWTLNFYYLDNSGIEQVYSDFSSETIQWWVQKVYLLSDIPTYDEHFFVPSDQVASLIDFTNISSDVISSTNNSKDLGSPSNKWKDLYLSGSSLYLGDGTLAFDNGFEFNKVTYSAIEDYGSVSGITFLDFSLSNIHQIELVGDTTLQFDNLSVGSLHTLIVEQDSVGGWLLAMPEGSKQPDGGAFEIVTEANASNKLSIYINALDSYCVTSEQNFQDLINLLQQQQKLIASDAQADDQFGHNVSISGDTVIVGAHFEDTGASNVGAAYIFTRSGGVWTEQQKIQASDQVENDFFGYSVSIDGDTVIVGAKGENTGGADAGAAYIFTRSGGVWTEQQKILASDKEANDEFGHSVSIDGDTVIVGAQGEDTGGSSAGAAYIFTRSGGVWTEQQKIQASDKQANANFGYSVSVDVNTTIVGAYVEDTGGADIGAAYIYTRSGGVWTEQQKIQASDKEALDHFGFDVSINGDTVIVGSILEDTGGANAGAAYIYTRSGGVWTEQQKIQASDKEASDSFGYSVSIDGDVVIVGAYVESTGGSSAGAAYMYTRSGGVWTEQQKIQASDKEANDQFGFSVSISGDTVIIGARGEDTGGSGAGASYIFK